MNNSGNLMETLGKALEMEEKGQKFYAEQVQKVKNEVTKKTFTFLADNEKLHIENIKNFCNTLREKGELPDVDLESVKDKRTKDLNIFSKTIKEFDEKINPSDDDKKACEFAMEFENSGYKYYESMLENAKDESLVKLLKFLLQEESRHYDGIQELYTYLTDSHNWFMYEEGSFPQGG